MSLLYWKFLIYHFVFAEESNAIEISTAESTSLAPEESTSTSPVEPDFEGGLSFAQTLIDILHGTIL